MKTIEIKPFGVKVNRQVAASVEEYDSLAKKTGACLEAALRYHNYHVDFSDIRDIVLHGQEEVKDEQGNIVQVAITGMEDAFGVERKTKPVLNKDGTAKMSDGKPVLTYDEKEEAFYERVVATKGISEADQTAFIQAVVDQLPWDPSTAERKPRAPKKLAAVWLEHAKKFLAGGKVAELSKRLHKSIGKEFVPTGDAAKDTETLGWLVKEYTEWSAQQSLGKLSA